MRGGRECNYILFVGGGGNFDEEKIARSNDGICDFTTLESISRRWSFQKKTGKVDEGDDCKMTLARFPGSIIESARLRSRPCMRNEKKKGRSI